MQEQLIDIAPVELRDVSKSYGGAVVLDGVTLAVAPSESLVLVGHNGAGKTTLMKLLLGLIRPSAGEVRVFGEDPTAASSVAQRGSVGYLPESIAFDEAMTGRELLNFYAALKGVNGNSSAELLERVGIADAADRRLGTWSKGMRQRLGLAQAMLGNPRLMLLDEPTSGLDPSARRSFYEIIEALRAAGVTVLISSHSLNEVEDHADRVAVMQQGRMLACGTLTELSEQADLPVHVRIVGAAEAVAAALDARFGAAAITINKLDEQHLAIDCAHVHKMALLREVTELGDAVRDVDIRLPRLDEIYAHYIPRDRQS